MNIYRYQPVIVSGPDGTDYRPRAELPEHHMIDLAVLDGWRYVVAPDAAELIVPEELDTWEPVTLTDELRETLKDISPHCILAREQFIGAIRAKYSLDDELYFSRIATGSLLGSYTMQPGEMEQLQAYQAHVEAARLDLHVRYDELVGMSGANA